MTDYISPGQFHAAEGVDDRRLTSEGATDTITETIMPDLLKAQPANHRLRRTLST